MPELTTPEVQLEKAKTFFQSRTVWWNILGLVAFQLLAWLVPKKYLAICENQELTIAVATTLFSAFCMVNLWLRKTTSCRLGKEL